MTAPPDPGRPPADASAWKLPRLRITRDGEWLHDDEEITHPGILANLQGNLRVDEQGHYLQMGPVRVPVEVADAPFVVLRVEAEGDELVLTLNDLSREPLAVGTLRFGEGGVPRCRVKDGRFAARLSRAAAHQLLARVEQDEAGGVPALRLGGSRYPLPALGARGE